jgi:hypothetical protein
VRSTGKARRALELEEVWDLRAKIAVDRKAADWDLIDFADFMLATGLRIGEALAVVWNAVDLEAGTVEVPGTVIRVTDEGIMIKPRPKSKAGCASSRCPLGLSTCSSGATSTVTTTFGMSSSLRRSGGSATRATHKVIFGTSSTGAAGVLEALHRGNANDVNHG